MKRTLIKNIGCLQTPVGSYSHKGSKQGINEKYQNAAIAIEDGIIRAKSSTPRASWSHRGCSTDTRT